MTDNLDALAIAAQVQTAAEEFSRGKIGARQRLVDVLRASQRTAEGPAAYLQRVRQQPLQNICHLIAIESGLLNAIVTRNGHVVSADDLAREIGQQDTLIVRVMRFLTANGVCNEVGPRSYSSNVVAALLNTPGHSGAVRTMTELMFPIAGKVVPLLRAEGGLTEFPGPGPGQPLFRATHGAPLFEYLTSHGEHKVAFDAYMADRKAGVLRQWYDLYPVQDRLIDGTRQEQESVFMIDVAGGRGHDLCDFRKSKSDIPGRLVLQDLSETLDSLGPSLAERGIEVKPYNFFEPQPIKGARAYFFRAVLHDWSDETAHTILTNTTQAMEKGYSKMIINEHILSDQQAPWRATGLDITMFIMTEGVERSLDQWEELLDKAGLRITGVWLDNDTGNEGVIEAELKIQ